jgi:hypothetical protein
MSDPEQENPYRKNNELGGHIYSEAEEMLILNIASLLRARDDGLQKAVSHSNIVKGLAPRPREYIFLYTKSAGFVYELAKNLHAYPPPTGVEQKSVCDWLTIVLGHSFKSVACEQLTIQETAVPSEGLLEDSVSALIADGIIENPEATGTA